jgi:DNA polymerase-3 subunit delta'
MTHAWLEPWCRELAGRIDGGRLGHAPLLTGSRGVGKRDIAGWLARRLLCLDPDGSAACGRCRSCQLVEAGAHPDFFAVEVAEDKQGIGVDQVRDLIERLQLTASVGQRRVGLLPSAEAMNVNAANALLKTLEEPADEAWLILVCERPEQLPATIRSRCQQIVIRVPEAGVAETWLASACPEASEDERALALAVAAGAPLAARDMIVSGDLAYGLEILEDLGREASSGEILERWQQQPQATWRWLARWLNLLMLDASRIGHRHPDLPVGLPAAGDRRTLLRLWQQALAGHREAVRGVVRQDLLLGRWLLEWEATLTGGG